MVIAVVVLALAAIGPRAVLRSRWLGAGAMLAVLGVLPYALWQLAHGLPQEQLARSIAQSGAEGGRIGFIPFQLVLIGPLLAPVWIAGLLKLLRDPALRPLRCFAAAYLVLIPLFIATGGKAYYVSGLYPVLLGAGAIGADRWLAHAGSRVARARAGLVIVAGALTAAASVVIGLPVLPARDLQGSVVMALNPDAGETVGWPRFANTVAGVYRSQPSAERARTAIFTQNYGEAGALAHFGASIGLPYPYSGHNGWALWGPPPNGDTVALLVGLDAQQAARSFTNCEVQARINNTSGLSNQEQGALVWVCTGERRPWSVLWPSLRHYD